MDNFEKDQYDQMFQQMMDQMTDEEKEDFFMHFEELVKLHDRIGEDAFFEMFEEATKGLTADVKIVNSYEVMLRKLSKPKLYHYGMEVLHLPGFYGLSKDKAVRALAQYYRDDRELAKRLQIIDDRALAVFDDLVNEKREVANEEMFGLEEIISTNYINMQYDEIIVPRTLIKQIERINNEAFSEQRRKLSWLYAVTQYTCVVYSVTDEAEILQLYQLKFHDDQEQVNKYFRMIEDLCDSELNHHVYYPKGLDNNQIQAIRRNQRKYNRSPITLAELEDYGHYGYPYHDHDYQALFRTLITDCSFNGYSAALMTSSIHDFIASGEFTVDDILDMMLEDGSLNTANFNQVKKCLKRVYRVTRSTNLNGHSLNDIDTKVS